MNLRSVLCVAVLLESGFATGAQPVYKCEEKGHIIYTDQPCAPAASAATMPGLIVTAPPTRSEQELARRWQQRVERERGERDRDDAAWLKQHEQRRDRDERVRRAIVEHRVIKGMTLDEVRRALGEPDRIDTGDSYGTDKQAWTYLDDDGVRKINFKDGEVMSTSRKGPRQR